MAEQRSTLPLPPQPPELPLWGSTGQILTRPVEYLIDTVNQQGQIFRTRTFGMPITVVSGPVVREMAGELESLPLDRAPIFEVWARGTGSDVFSASGERHEMQRRLLRYGLARGVGSAFLADMVTQVEARIADWKLGATVTMLDELAEMSLDCLMATLTPVDLSDLREDILFYGTGMLRILARHRPLFFLNGPRHTAARRRIRARLREVVEQHQRGDFSAHPRASVVDALLHARKTSDDEVDLEAIVSQIMLILSTLFGYMSRATSFTLYHVLRDPGLLASIRSEVDHAFNEGPLSARRLRQLPHLRAAFMEALRRYPMVPGIIYQTTAEIELLGYRVPRGDILIFTQLPTHHDPKLYEHPQEFRVEHWLSPPSGCPHAARFMPFGVGPRSCVARGLMETMGLLVCATILRSAELALPSPTYQITPVPNPLNGPQDRLPLRFSGLRTPSKGPRAAEKWGEYWLDEPQEGPRMADAKLLSFGRGVRVFSQGDASEHFFVLVKGAIAIWRDDQTEAPVARLSPGQGFGELGLLKSAGRSASAIADSDVEVFALSREAYLKWVYEHDLTADDIGEALWHQHVTELFASVLPGLRPQASQELVRGSRRRSLPVGETIIRQGEFGSRCYALLSGEVQVTQTHNGQEVEIARLKTGSVFGELSILNQQPRVASVTVVGEAPADVLEIPGDVLLGAVSRSTQVRNDLNAEMSRRLYEVIEVLVKAGGGGASATV